MKKIKNSGFRNWKPNKLPDLAGKTYLVTGGNSGIGFEAAKMLAGAGADVLIAARNPEKGECAAAAVAAEGAGSASHVLLDLADMGSIRAAVDDVSGRIEKLDGLINNAGIMQTPPRQTADGFELQFGTNHLGHFLLTGLLFGLVEKAQGRIVQVSSLAHAFGRIHFNDLMLSKRYDPSRAYAQSKLANLMFALELDRRLKKAGSAVTAYACHPGYSNTNLQSTGPTGGLKFLYGFTNVLMAQSSYRGAIPTVLCAAGEEALAGGYYGPTGFGGARGPVSDAAVSGAARDEAAGARLWAESEKLVGFSWDTVLRR
jgi:NAD(P)-dependent dehydrogenase (short-subunit alcohol dehydrogenase family)